MAINVRLPNGTVLRYNNAQHVTRVEHGNIILTDKDRNWVATVQGAAGAIIDHSSSLTDVQERWTPAQDQFARDLRLMRKDLKAEAKITREHTRAHFNTIDAKLRAKHAN